MFFLNLLNLNFKGTEGKYMIKNNCAECLLRIKEQLEQARKLEKEFIARKLSNPAIQHEISELKRSTDDEVSRIHAEYIRINNHINKKKVLNDKDIEDINGELKRYNKQSKASELMKVQLDKLTKKEQTIKNEYDELSEFKRNMNAQVSRSTFEIHKIYDLITGQKTVSTSKYKSKEVEKERHYLPYPKFSPGVTIESGNKFQDLFVGFADYAIEEATAVALTNAFEAKSFQEILKQSATALGVDIQSLLVVSQFKSRVYLKYAFNAELNEKLKPVGGKFDFTSTKSWYLIDEKFEPSAVAEVIGQSFKAAILVNSKVVLIKK